MTTPNETQIAFIKLGLAAVPLALLVGCAVGASDRLSTTEDQADTIAQSQQAEEQVATLVIVEDQNVPQYGTEDTVTPISTHEPTPTENYDVTLLDNEHNASEELHNESSTTTATLDAEMVETVTETSNTSVDDAIAAVEAVDTTDTPNQTTTITVPEQSIFHFPTNAFQIGDEDRVALQQHAQYLAANPGLVLIIGGHADNRGSSDANLELSQRRARAVAALLVDFGAPENQIQVNGFSDRVPMENPDNWDQNRRVELEYSEVYVLSGK